MNLTKLAASVATLAFVSTALAANYKIDAGHSQVGFKVKHMMISSVNGRFPKHEGAFKYDSKTGKLEDVKVTIDASSIDTNEADRDKHLRDKDFFDVTTHKTLDFTAKGATIAIKKSGEVKGDLTIRGVTKPVTLKVDLKGEVTDPWGNQRIGFEAKGKINRKDFGLTWNKNLDKGGVAVGDDVEIIIESEAIMQKEAAAASEKK